jgi:uncharacterized membrane protein
VASFGVGFLIARWWVTGGVLLLLAGGLVVLPRVWNRRRLRLREPELWALWQRIRGDRR